MWGAVIRSARLRHPGLSAIVYLTDMQAKKRGRRRGQDPEPPPAPPAAGSALPAFLAGALILCFVIQRLASMGRQSATFDEPFYIAAGYLANFDPTATVTRKFVATLARPSDGPLPV